MWLKPGTADLSAHITTRAANVRIASIHWGDNWGYKIPSRQQQLAYSLIDRGGASIVHGHSSHHPKGIEYYHGGLILYGAGDFINDYEGIPGHERYRPELTLGYLVDVDPTTGCVETLEARAFRLRTFRLERASREEGSWPAERLARVSPPREPTV
ncbi:MAG: CapA family protein [Spirochaetota bacterium]